MPRVGCQAGADALVTARALHVVGRGQLRIALDVRIVRVAVTCSAGRAATNEAFALPQAEGVVREAPRTTVGPVRGIVRLLRSVFEEREEVVVVVRPGRESWGHDVAERMA